MAFIWKLDVQELFWLWYCYLPSLTNWINLFWFSLQRGSWWRLLKGNANLSKYGHALTWFASNILIAHDKKTQAMILGNPFQEPVIHIGYSVIF